MTSPHPPPPPARYLDHMRQASDASAIWDYLRYDADGDLWINGLRVVDAIDRYGTPLEIVDTTVVERRAREWMALSRAVAAEAGYPGRLRYLYAAKANMASEVTHAAYRSGWDAETSAVQDLEHLEWMAEQGVLRRDIRVVCNGFKLPPACLGSPAADVPPAAGDVVLPPLAELAWRRVTPYADKIVALARAGWDIVPILDEGEIDTFLDPAAPPMNVGLRLKFGPVTSREALDALVSRFGLDRAALAAAAARIAASDHLKLTTLHAMVGAAEMIPVPDYVASLTLACELWAGLRRAHPALTELNVGGGMPPLGEPYDHRAVLRGLFDAALAASARAGVPPPDVTFELGSLIASEAGFHVFKVVQHKANHHPATDGVDAWALIDGGLMAAIPDMLLIDKAFRFLAARHAHAPARLFRLGDLTCDSDGRYPPKSFAAKALSGESFAAESFAGEAGVWLPDAPGESFVVIQGVGAYQEILAGVRGAHHCGLLEAIELIIERGADGVVRGRLMPRQTADDAAKLLGYTDVAARALGRTMPSPEPTPGG